MVERLLRHWSKKVLALVLTGAMAASLSVGAFAAQSNEEVVLNSAVLESVEPKSEALQSLLDELMPEITGVDDSRQEGEGGDQDDVQQKTTYEQIKACYDYVSSTVRYGSHISKLGTPIGNTTCRQIYQSYGEVEGYGAVALTANVGLCNAYSAAFILMARRIGLDANLVKGETRSAGGGYAYHEWTEVYIDGVTYVFDPQLEGDLLKAGLPAYTVFCKTYDQLGNRYRKY